MDAAQNLSPSLDSLAEKMALEPFCRQHRLERQTLAQVNQILEEQDKQNQTDPSFLRFKADFCLFLMELEAKESLSADRLGTLSLSDYLTVTDATVIGITNLAKPAPTRTPVPIEVVFSAPVPEEAPVSWEPEEEVTEAAIVKPAGPSFPAALEYHALAQYFQNQRSTNPQGISLTHWLRLETQAVCSSIEVEIQECASDAIAKFWEGRKENIAHIWNPQTPKPEFHPAVLESWNSLAPHYWPSGEPLPLLTLKNSLRFLASSTDSSVPRPSLLELGLWLFLFGQSNDLGGFSLKNSLGLPPFETKVLADVFLRLCRVHRLKGILLNPSGSFSEALRNEAQDHAVALFSFTQSWRNGRK